MSAPRLAAALCWIVGSAAVRAAPGDVDLAFAPGMTANVDALAVQPDGKIVAGGPFTTVGGSSRPYIVRLHESGGIDGTFNGLADYIVSCVGVQPDGGLVFGGDFTAMNGVARSRIGRLSALGALDAGFIVSASDTARNLVLLPDGSVLFGGRFTTINGTAPRYLVKTDSSGIVDPLYNPSPSSSVRTAVLQPDGKLIVGGHFVSVGGGTRPLLARLHASGAVDPTFNANMTGTAVYCVALQADGKVLIGGLFSAVDGTPRSNVARLHANGTVDAAFNPGANELVRSIVVQTDGRIIFTGIFTTFRGVTRNCMARLLGDSTGTLDVFNPNASDQVTGAVIQANGKVLAGGQFSTIGGVARRNLARLENDPATQSLTVPAPTLVQWMRGGTSPESHEVTFEISTNGGTAWTPLGAGTRITGGWELTGLTLPGAGQVKARARTHGGYGNGSAGLVETVTAYSLTTPLEEWRDEFFDTMENTGPAANNADPDKDGLENLVEFAFGLNPTTPDAASLPQWDLSDDDYNLTFTRPPGVSGITYVAEYSASLALGSWTAAPNSGTPPNYSFFAPAVTERLYLRVRVTVP